MFTICKEYVFEAAHRLPSHAGKCQNLHGHSYRVEVEVYGRRLQTTGSSDGMLIDFAVLDQIMKPTIADHLDHKYLNESIGAIPSTAEKIARWIGERVTNHLRTKQYEDVGVQRVTVWETSKSRATWRPD